MYELTCHSVSESRRITASLSKETRATHLGGFYLSTSYTCCVSEVYNHYYYTRSLCTVLNTTSGRQNMHIVNNITMSISYSTGTDSTYWYTSTSTDTDSTPAAQASITSNTIEWALGGIIIVLLILLALSVITNMCWLCPGFRKRVLPTKLSQFVDSSSKSSSTLPVRANVSYLTTPSSRSATENSYQNDRATDQSVSAVSNPNYSSIGPAYETLTTTRRQQRQEGGREIPISERYEFAEIHTDTDRRVQVGVSASDYEVPRESVHIGDEDSEYSRLQH